MNTMNQKTKNKKLNKSRGFSLLFAILIGSLLMGIGISITNLALKQLSISSISRESQKAFYAADSGVECALYWDIHGRDLNNTSNPFNFASVSSSDTLFPSIGTMKCGVSIPLNDEEKQITTDSASLPNFVTNIFEVDFGTPSPCALVVVRKYKDGKNVIESNGINDCSSRANPYRVQRSIRVEYR